MFERGIKITYIKLFIKKITYIKLKYFIRAVSTSTFYFWQDFYFYFEKMKKGK